MSQQIQVLFPQKLHHAFDYLWTGNQPIHIGQIVMASMRQVRRPGLVVGVEKRPIPAALQEVQQSLLIPPLQKNFLTFLKWMSQYTMTPHGIVLKMAFGGVFQQQPDHKKQSTFKLMSWAASTFSNTDGSTNFNSNDFTKPDVFAHLWLSGFLFGKRKPVFATSADQSKKTEHIVSLTSAQKEGVVVVHNALKQRCFQPFLLDGVTGSGKTEVYFEALEHVHNTHGQSLVLLPEINLTYQWVERFVRRFGFSPLQWHSKVSAREKRLVWHQVVRGKPCVLVGTRSALFLPFQNLQCLVVDEEHDQSYKQEEGGSIYHGRDMAVVRAKYENIPIVLASATPSLETLENVKNKKYYLIRLKKRAQGASLPYVQLIDLRQASIKAAEWISPKLLVALQNNQKAGNLSLLFLNRRGYAPLLLCRYCGHRFQCPQCSVWLAQHQKQQKLLCHHCGYGTTLPDVCPGCTRHDTLASCGPGVERILEELSHKVPDIKAQIITSDHHTLSIQKMLDMLEKREIDVLIGTQILAKGHDFSSLTLVGIIDADMGMIGGDPRAQEKSFQLLHQVSGRAGRGYKPGTVYLQTHQPESPLIQSLIHYDRDGLMAYERKARQLVQMPPFGRLSSVIIASKNEKQAEKVAYFMAQHRPRAQESIKVLGPMPAPLYKKNNWYRWRFLLKAPMNQPCQPFLAIWQQKFRFPLHVKIIVDIDPQSFM